MPGFCGTRRRSLPGRDQCSARGSGEGEQVEASNKLTTGLQHACNFLATPAIIRHCYGDAPVPRGGDDRVPPAENSMTTVPLPSKHLIAEQRLSLSSSADTPGNAGGLLARELLFESERRRRDG